MYCIYLFIYSFIHSFAYERSTYETQDKNYGNEGESASNSTAVTGLTPR